MGQLVCNGAMCQCSFGLAPSALMVLPDKMVMGSNMPAANIMDNKPMLNVMPFGMCTCQANPAVAAATAAALGTPTPAPCIPVIAAPWTPGCPTVLVKNQPALNNSSTLMCSYGGTITIKSAGQATVQIP
ncbi:MAG: DUF4280 domain-containing protein [Clostridia bacterium]|nr:DUF4280 domain-containing protein [Clostridia bacterium]